MRAAFLRTVSEIPPSSASSSFPSQYYISSIKDASAKPKYKKIYFFLKHCNSHALRHFWLEIAGTAISQIPGILLCTVLLSQLKSIY